MKRDQVKVGMSVKVDNAHSDQIYFVKELFYKHFCVDLEYKNAAGEMVSGGTIDVSVIKEV